MQKCPQTKKISIFIAQLIVGMFLRLKENNFLAKATHAPLLFPSSFKSTTQSSKFFRADFHRSPPYTLHNDYVWIRHKTKTVWDRRNFVEIPLFSSLLLKKQNRFRLFRQKWNFFAHFMHVMSKCNEVWIGVNILKLIKLLTYLRCCHDFDWLLWCVKNTLAIIRICTGPFHSYTSLASCSLH